MTTLLLSVISQNVFLDKLLHTLSAMLHHCHYSRKADNKAMNVTPLFSFSAEKKTPGEAVCLRELGWKRAVTEPALRTHLGPGPTLGQWERAAGLPAQTSWDGVSLGDVTQSFTREELKQPPKQLTRCGFLNKLGFSLFFSWQGLPIGCLFRNWAASPRAAPAVQRLQPSHQSALTGPPHISRKKSTIQPQSLWHCSLRFCRFFNSHY